MSQTRRRNICSSFGERVNSLRTSVSRTFRRITSSSMNVFRRKKVVSTRNVGTDAETDSESNPVSGRSWRNSRVTPITVDAACQTQQVRFKWKRRISESQIRFVNQRREEWERLLSPGEVLSHLALEAPHPLTPPKEQQRSKKIPKIPTSNPNLRKTFTPKRPSDAIPLYYQETLSSSLKRHGSRSASVSPSFNSKLTATAKFSNSDIRSARSCSPSRKFQVRAVGSDTRPTVPGPGSSLSGRADQPELESSRQRVPSSNTDVNYSQSPAQLTACVKRTAMKKRRSDIILATKNHAHDHVLPKFLTNPETGLPLSIGLSMQRYRNAERRQRNGAGNTNTKKLN